MEKRIPTRQDRIEVEQKNRSAIAQSLAGSLSKDLYVIGSKYKSKAVTTGHKRLNGFVEDLLEMSRWLHQIEVGLLPDYEEIPDADDDTQQ
jgi:hypothetical protein